MATKESKTAATNGTITKADAARAVLSDGIDTPEAGVEAVKSRYGIVMTKGHFSAEKARYAQKQAVATPAAKRGRPAKVVVSPKSPAPKAQERVTAAQPQAAGDDKDLLNAIEQMKPLVASLGVDKVKRIAELLG